MSEHRQAPNQFRAPTLECALEAVTVELTVCGALSPQSLARLVELMRRLTRFVEHGFGVTTPDRVLASHVVAFVMAPTASGTTPSIATMHLRRSAVRLFFRISRQLGFVGGDPTLDLQLRPRSSISVRPLTDDEVALCRTATLQSLTGTRLSAAWALAEATARTAELPRIVVADLDLPALRVWVHGSSRTEARWGGLSEWGAQQLERRIEDCARTGDHSTPLVYGGAGSAESRQASSCQAIGETLRRAALATEPDVRPLSVAAWAGAQVFAETGRIEAAARALGVRSLDGAARLIDLDWRIGGEEP